MLNAFSGKTKLFCLLGNPVEHSLSPQMHNVAFRKLNLDFAYVALKVEESRLADAINGIKALGIHGGNVTMPHKTPVIKFLDECDEIATEIGAVNTFVNDNGKLRGFNTDCKGALMALQEKGVPPKNKKVVIIGAGGAAKAVSYAVAMSKPNEIVIFNRTMDKAVLIAKMLNKKFCYNSRALKLGFAALKTELKDTDILINCSSAGMHPNTHDTPVPKKFLHKNLTVMDVVYDPLETRLLKEAKAAGAETISGAQMLVNQGALSFEIFTGRKAPVELMKNVVMEKL